LYLTAEQQEHGRQNFRKALAGSRAERILDGAELPKAPLSGGPVRLGFIGVGVQGRNDLKRTDPAFADVRALCDINPSQLAKADAVLVEQQRKPGRHYEDWQEMVHKEDLEGVVIATPLSTHAEIAAGCLEAGKHVLCEKMMAWDEAGLRRMIEAARKSGRILEIGYHRFYNRIYEAAYEGIVKPGLLGDVYMARLVWHRNADWRRNETPPSPTYDPSKWGYPDFDHLINWRLYWKYSQGLMAELGSHMVNVSNWFFGTTPHSVWGSGGVFLHKQGREVPDHVYATFEYPGNRSAVFTSIESNAFEGHYEAFLGTKATLILTDEREAYLFEDGTQASFAANPLAPPASSSGSGSNGNTADNDLSHTAPHYGGGEPYRVEVSRFCLAVRKERPLACGPELASHSARACIRANQAIQQQKRLPV
jgi:predicted dehydrogenase